MAQEEVAAVAVAVGAAVEEVVVPKVSFSAFKPQLVVAGHKADEAVAFYKAAFGADEVKRVSYPKRKADQESPLVLCAEVKIGGTVFVVCDQIGEENVGSNADSGIVFRLETEDIQTAVANAVKAGAQIEGEIAEEEGPCGAALSGKVKDPFGYVWTVSSSPAASCA